MTLFKTVAFTQLFRFVNGSATQYFPLYQFTDLFSILEACLREMLIYENITFTLLCT